MEHHEESYVMFLNRANKALGVSLISKGGMAENCNGRENHLANRLESPCFGHNTSHITTHRATYVRVNRTNKFASKIKEACKVLDLHFLDHIILTEESYYSFADRGAFYKPFFTLSLPNTKSLMAFTFYPLQIEKNFP